MTSIRNYTISEVALISKFSIRQLDYWARQGILVPSVNDAKGSGSKRLYGFEDIVKLRFIKQMKRVGLSTQKIREIVVRLSDIMNDPDPLKSAVLICDKQIVVAIFKANTGDNVAVDILKPGGQQVLKVYLEVLLHETTEAILSMEI